MASFGIVKRDEALTRHGVLMIVDNRADADEIAWELNRLGQSVDVRLLEPRPA
jgi:hypothetical protein